MNVSLTQKNDLKGGGGVGMYSSCNLCYNGLILGPAKECICSV